MKLAKFSISIVLFLIANSALAQTVPQPPIEAYGTLPSLRAMSISPNGSKLGYIQTLGDKEVFVVYDLKTQNTNAVDTTDVKTGWTGFINDRFALLSASETTRILGFRGKLEYTTAFSFDQDKKKIIQLLKRESTLYPGQSGIGRIVGNLAKNGRVLMPAYVGFRGNENPTYNLFAVNPESGTAYNFEEGRNTTFDWFVGREGTIFARENHNEKRNLYEIETKRNGKWETLFSKENSSLLPFNLVGVKSDESGLILIDDLPDGSGEALFEMNWKGEISEPLFVKDNLEIDSTIKDSNRKVFGVRYSGMRPSYSFFDPTLDASIQKLINDYPNYAISIDDWTEDWSKLIVKISGGTQPSGYFLYDTQNNALTKMGDTHAISSEWIGETITIEYAARDGTKIPAILTLPAQVKDHKNLPTIILPHGGPESYDQLDFYWLSQYFASRGYLVLQPNFRGSSGFGWNFRKQGRGEWGGLMQDDVTDGLKALIDGGFSDPNRVCIVGASYGGYSALAGGAFTPDLYKCVAAIAPVSDLPRMLLTEKREHNSDSMTVAYWSKVIGDRKEDAQKLENASPVNHASAFKAPVLLLHGNDDTVVNIDQSKAMKNALEKAGKDVTLKIQKGGDHWLSTSETRMETLISLDEFVTKHNPPH